MSNVLAVSDLIAGYSPTLPILHGVSVTVEAGEIVTILGPNGAGKSTLIKAIAGLLHINSGQASLLGTDLSGFSTHEMVRAGLGYVPQTENVFAKLSVEENLEIGALINRDAYSRQLEYVFDLFQDLARLRRLPAGKLSGGQRQMVAVGRALMADPKLLMLDEPSAGLSPKLAEAVFSQLRKISAAGTTILMVEQNARAALRVSDRGYVLAEGQNRLDGDAASLLDNPEVGKLYLGAGSRLSQ